jgi:Fe-S-cluster-containing dehydrogenase component
MSYTITSQCIECSRCVSACPTSAIKHDGDRHWIDSTLCNNCVGFYSVAQCVAACPTNHGCIPGLTSAVNHPSLLKSSDYWERWFATYERLVFGLHDSKRSPYWQNWFDAYSTKLSTLLHSHQAVNRQPSTVN